MGLAEAEGVGEGQQPISSSGVPCVSYGQAGPRMILFHGSPNFSHLLNYNHGREALDVDVSRLLRDVNGVDSTWWGQLVSPLWGLLGTYLPWKGFWRILLYSLAPPL